MKTRKERLLSKVIKSDHCWEWQGAVRDKMPYGSMYSHKENGKNITMAAHRVSWLEHIGDIPLGLWVLHRCDNPRCVNPDHLFLGDRKDNVDDRESKLRNNTPKKVTDEQVAEIRALKDFIRARGLALVYVLSVHTIRDIWCGKTRNTPYYKSLNQQEALMDAANIIKNIIDKKEIK